MTEKTTAHETNAPQEISIEHPAVKVQFELDLALGDAALACKTCARQGIKDSKREKPKYTAISEIVGLNIGARDETSGTVSRLHPPHACGMTVFGSANAYTDVAALAARHDAALVVLLRINHVAHAISSYRHFGPNWQLMPLLLANGSRTISSAQEVPWGPEELARAVEEARQAYTRLLQFPNRTNRPAHLIFYEDMARQPASVWGALERFLDLPTAIVSDDALRGLEQRASDRPAVSYLTQLARIREALGEEEWADMLDPTFDYLVDPAEAFEEACRLFPSTAGISWRGGSCNGLYKESLSALGRHTSTAPLAHAVAV